MAVHGPGDAAEGNDEAEQGGAADEARSPADSDVESITERQDVLEESGCAPLGPVQGCSGQVPSIRDAR